MRFVGQGAAEGGVSFFVEVHQVLMRFVSESRPESRKQQCEQMHARYICARMRVVALSGLEIRAII